MPSALFTPFQQRSVVMPNRLVLSPMAQYSAKDGTATAWHEAHYAKMAQGGVGTVIVESTSVSFQGNGTYGDLGIWNDVQTQALARIASLIDSLGAVPGIQLGHAGRKGALKRAFDGYGHLDDEDIARGEKPWTVVGPGTEPFSAGALVPAALNDRQLEGIILEWVNAAKRALLAGFKILEIHAAHGYLLNQFLSPLANQRNDRWGGDAARRMAFPLEVIKAVMKVWPVELPVWVRVSVIDDADGGRTLDDTLEFVACLKALGVDLIDCSTGGWSDSPGATRLKREPGFQVPFAQAVRQKSGLPVMAVGLITEPLQAEQILTGGQADLIAIGRELLVDPNWPHRARAKLENSGYSAWPAPYGWWLQRRREG